MSTKGEPQFDERPKDRPNYFAIKGFGFSGFWNIVRYYADHVT